MHSVRNTRLCKQNSGQSIMNWTSFGLLEQLIIEFRKHFDVRGKVPYIFLNFSLEFFCCDLFIFIREFILNLLKFHNNLGYCVFLMIVLGRNVFFFIVVCVRWVNFNTIRNWCWIICQTTRRLPNMVCWVVIIKRLKAETFFYLFIWYKYQKYFISYT